MVNWLKTKNDFEAFRKSKSYQTPQVRIRVRSQANQNSPRFGFIVPKKVLAKATDRNLIKRRIKFFLTKNLAKIRPVDILIFPNSQLFKKKFSELELELTSLFSKANLWK
jgi:ribonuclease P protein component